MGLKRKITVKMRLTEEEKALLEQRMSDADIQNREAYLRRMALTGCILQINMSEVRETLRLLSNATSNVNQVAKQVNETRSVYAADVTKLQNEVNHLRVQISDIMKVFIKVQRFMDL